RVAQLPVKIKALDEVNQKLKVAETGHVREIVSQKSQLSNEGTLLQTIQQQTKFYKDGLSFAKLQNDYDATIKTVGPLTGDPAIQKELQLVRAAIQAGNKSLMQHKAAIEMELSQQHELITTAIKTILARHAELRQTIDAAEEKLRKQG